MAVILVLYNNNNNNKAKREKEWIARPLRSAADDCYFAGQAN